jgi:hypothetical protein
MPSFRSPAGVTFLVFAASALTATSSHAQQLQQQQQIQQMQQMQQMQQQAREMLKADIQLDSRRFLATPQQVQALKAPNNDIEVSPDACEILLERGSRSYRNALEKTYELHLPNLSRRILNRALAEVIAPVERESLILYSREIGKSNFDVVLARLNEAYLAEAKALESKYWVYQKLSDRNDLFTGLGDPIKNRPTIRYQGLMGRQFDITLHKNPQAQAAAVDRAMDEQIIKLVSQSIHQGETFVNELDYLIRYENIPISCIKSQNWGGLKLLP